MNKKIIILALIFFASFFLSFFIAKISSANPLLEKDAFSKEQCIRLNMFREHCDNDDNPETLQNINEIDFEEGLIDTRTEEKFSRFHLNGTINIPIWMIILSPGKYEDSADSNFICFYNEANRDSRKVCLRYLRNLLYLLYNQTEAKININIIDDEMLADEWEYYKIEDLDENENYIVFYEELNLDNFTLINPNQIDDIDYLEENISKDKGYNIICTNDFSCLHSWAVKEKLKTQGFNNIKDIIKLISLG